MLAFFLRTLRQVDQPGAMQGGHGFLGIVLQLLANDEDGLAVAVTVRVREGDVCRERNVAGQFLPKIPELVAIIPDVVAGGVEGVLLGAGVVTGAPGNNGPPMSACPSKIPSGVSKSWRAGESPPAAALAGGWRSRAAPSRARRVPVLPVRRRVLGRGAVVARGTGSWRAGRIGSVFSLAVIKSRE